MDFGYTGGPFVSNLTGLYYGAGWHGGALIRRVCNIGGRQNSLGAAGVSCFYTAQLYNNRWEYRGA